MPTMNVDDYDSAGQGCPGCMYEYEIAVGGYIYMGEQKEVYERPCVAIQASGYEDDEMIKGMVQLCRLYTQTWFDNKYGNAADQILNMAQRNEAISEMETTLEKARLGLVSRLEWNTQK